MAKAYLMSTSTYTMRCGECHRPIDPETDRHVEVVETHVAPDLGLEGSDGRVLCVDCRPPDEKLLAP